MAYFKISSYHYADIADHWFATGLLAIKRQVAYQDRLRSAHHHATGIAAIGFGVLFADGLQPAAWPGQMAAQ